MAQTSFLLARPPAEDKLRATAQETHCGGRREAEAEGGAQLAWGEVGGRERTKRAGVEDTEAVPLSKSQASLQKKVETKYAFYLS